MGAQWLWIICFVAAVQGLEIDDELYYEMPKLYQLDDWEECLASRRGAFCLGTFDLLPHTNDRLMNYIQNISMDKFNFNHSHIHRGYCVSSRCDFVGDRSLRARFERCVENITREQYGLRTNLTQLHYCRTAKQPGGRPVDGIDLAFAYFVGVVLLMNLVGTAYDILRNKDHKPNKYLMTWSLKVNWGRLTANYTDGDQRLADLKPVQGMKVLTLMLVMMAHSVFAFHITYLENPRFLEKTSRDVSAVLFQNGTSIVQTFIMVSSFLLTYNLLIHNDTDPNKKLSLAMFPKCWVHRITRMAPLHLCVVWFAVSWWGHGGAGAGPGAGPLWPLVVGAEGARCRRSWWTHPLYMNNALLTDQRCMVHTWFLAVDMQVYVVTAALVLALGRSARAVARVVPALMALTVLANFLASYYFELRPMVNIMYPEYMRVMFLEEHSFRWLYTMPWDSLPAALLGLLLAHAHYHLQARGYRPRDHLAVRIAYQLSIPGMFAWVLLGYFMKSVTAPLPIALYAALDRPIFATIVATAMYGFINKIDSVYWRFMSWRGWEVLGRLALPAYLAHWLVAVTQLAYRDHLSPVSIHEIGGHYLFTVLLTYLVSLPLHLLLEAPLSKFLQALFS